MSRTHTSLLHWLREGRRRRRAGLCAKAQPTALGEVLAQLEPGNSPQPCPVPRDLWQQVVGPRIADRSEPLRLERDRTLVVRVASSSWAQELSLLSATILERLGAHNIPLRQLRFLVSSVEPVRRQSERFVRCSVPHPAALPSELCVALQSVEDPALRELIARAASSSLGEQAARARKPSG